MIMNTAATTKATQQHAIDVNNFSNVEENIQQQVHNEKKNIIQLQKQINTQSKRKVENMWKWINYKNPFEVNKKKTK